MPSLSPRLRAIVDGLPLHEGMRVVEFGCGPGAAAREVARRIGSDGFVLAVDRSATAVAQVHATAAELIATGRLAARQCAVEDFEPAEREAAFDLAFAVRVGVLDGRHPEARIRALERIRRALTPEGRLFVDGVEVDLERLR